jgi:UDP-glucose 4-epimerase
MILITGGGGLIGLSSARHLAEKGKEVLLLDNRPIQVPTFLAEFWGNQVTGVVGDILDLSFSFWLVKKYPIQSIIHAAAIWEGRQGESSLYQVGRVNLEGAMNILEVGRIFDLRRITFISSLSVYYGQTGSWHEDLDLQVASFDDVSSTKKAAEHICSLYAKTYGLSVSVVRLARVYGSLARWGRNPMEVMIKNAVAGEPTDLSHVSGKSCVAPIYVKDCAKGISLVHLAEAPKHNIYNLGDGKFYSWFEVAEIVSKLIPDAEIRLGTGEPAVNFFPMSIDRIKEETGFAPDYDINQGIRAYIDWLKEGKY